MKFFKTLLEAEGDWDYIEWEPEFTGPMFEEDPGDRNVRGTVRRFKAWKMDEEGKREKQRDLEGFMTRDRSGGKPERSR
jgi:nicotinamide N-methyltransferase